MIADPDAALHSRGKEPGSRHYLSKAKDSQLFRGAGPHKDLVTRTVAGFDDFVTTVDNTVIIFTPGVDAPGKFSFSQFDLISSI